MKSRIIDNLNVGDVLYCDVYDNRGFKLFTRGTILGPLYIEMLRKRGIDRVCICTKENEVKSISIEDFNETRTSVRTHSLAHRFVNNALKQEPVASLFNNSSEHVKEHSYNVALYTAILLSDKMKGFLGDGKEIIIGALLHDVGKNHIPPNIMFAPRKVTDEEFEIIKLHVSVGHSILTKKGFSDIVTDIALHHHETAEGKGYPYQLKGDEIPWYVDLVHICDMYEALCSKRIYKKSRLRESAVNTISKQKQAFHPLVYELFMTKMPKHFIGDLLTAYNRIYEVIGYSDDSVPILRELISHKDILYSEISKVVEPVDIFREYLEVQ